MPNLHRGSGGAMQYTGIRTHDSRSMTGLSESQTGSRTYYINYKMAVNLRYQKATRNKPSNNTSLLRNLTSEHPHALT